MARRKSLAQKRADKRSKPNKPATKRGARPAPITNRCGLTRAIPAEVMRGVRQRCFFGCVICGGLPYDYEHFDPEFSDARTHSVDGIALLCTRHHRERTAGRMSVATVRTHRARPYNETHDPIWTHSLGADPLTLVFAGSRFLGSSVGLGVGVVLNGKDVIRLSWDAGDVQWKLSGSLYDLEGTRSLMFEGDEVRIYSGSWDVEQVGTRLTVRAGARKIVAQLDVDAEARVVTLTRLRMKVDGIVFDGDADELRLLAPGETPLTAKTILRGNTCPETGTIGFTTRGG